MKTFKQFLKEAEALYEMSNAAIDLKRGREIWVENPAGYNNKYFKYTNSVRYNNATKIARISMLDSKYITGHSNPKGVKEWKLTKTEKRELLEFLKNDKDVFGFNAWKRTILAYNNDNCQILRDRLQAKLITEDDYNKLVDEYNKNLKSNKLRIEGAIRLDLPIPDYNKLPEK